MSDGFVCLAKLADVNAARVAEARLRSEGIRTRLHGEALGPFPVTIGKLAETEIWVSAEHSQLATDVLADLGIDCEPV